jgi:anti-sigma regulatory factor (Ser/Thr protein kinase)
MRALIATTDLPDAPGSAKVARTFVREALDQWQCDGAVDAAVLIASELVTNAVLHARTAMSVTLALSADRLKVAVRDHNEKVPVIPPYDIAESTGRGLAMLASIASAWGVEREADGKSVWFEIDV